MRFRITLLNGRVVLVTGSAQGLGRPLALGLADAGAAVAVADIQVLSPSWRR